MWSWYFIGEEIERVKHWEMVLAEFRLVSARKGDSVEMAISVHPDTKIYTHKQLSVFQQAWWGAGSEEQSLHSLSRNLFFQIKCLYLELGGVAHDFRSSTGEAEAGISP